MSTPIRDLPTIRIGCAGWSLAGPHAGLFDGGDSMLARYATRFNCVEINSSFYRPHQRKTYHRWAASVPADFRFSVKAPKVVTHEKALIGCGVELDRFTDEIAGLGEKLGGVLVQLPPSLAFDARMANGFFGMLRRRFAGEIACEPRHPTWFGERVMPIWARHGIARVAADPVRAEGADIPSGGGAWRYTRLHGSPRMYYSQYETAALQSIADRALDDVAAGLEPWVIFDNTAHCHATTDALALRSLVSSRS